MTPDTMEIDGKAEVPANAKKIWSKTNWEDLKKNAQKDPYHSRAKLIDRINKLHAAHNEHIVIMCYKINDHIPSSSIYCTPGIAADFMADPYGQLIQNSWPVIMREKATLAKSITPENCDSVHESLEEDISQENAAETNMEETNINTSSSNQSPVNQPAEEPGPSSMDDTSSSVQQQQSQQSQSIELQEFLHHMVEEDALRRYENMGCPVDETEVHVKVEELLPFVSVLLKPAVLIEAKKCFTEDALKTVESTLKVLADMHSRKQVTALPGESYKGKGKGKGKGKSSKVQRKANQKDVKQKLVEETMSEISGLKGKEDNTSHPVEKDEILNVLQDVFDIEGDRNEHEIYSLEETVTDDVFPIERLVSRKVKKGRVFYEVQWRGHTKTTLEPASNIPMWIRKTFSVPKK